jgi:uncharacterized membrane protein required for colicin V production
MLDSLVLDALLIAILLLLIPIGMYRGGVREVCTSAGLLLGILVSSQWTERWGQALEDVTGIDPEISRFVVAVATIVVITGVIGYGAAASFPHRPGPGGRIFGGLIALANGIVFVGAMIQLVSTQLNDGEYPDIVREAYVARALSAGFDWVLLVVTFVALLGILFGMIVRERDPEGAFADIPVDHVQAPERRPIRPTLPAVEPVKTEPIAAEQVSEPTAAIKIKEVRHWEEAMPTSMDELQQGWSRTWPSTVKQVQPGNTRSQSNRPATYGRKPAQSPDEAVIRDWLSEETSPGHAPRDRTRPASDE